MSLEWMAWTPVPTATFFYHHLFDAMRHDIWQMMSAQHHAPGIFTHRHNPGRSPVHRAAGQRYIHLAWLGLTDISLFVATAIAVVWMVVVMRWG
jgi:predicted small integral membrane protein